jgi:hypothetical protein
MKESGEKVQQRKWDRTIHKVNEREAGKNLQEIG